MATNGEENNNSYWTWQQDKALEKGLAMYPIDCEDRWHKIAQMIPGSKQPDEVRQHHQQLLHSIANIHAAANAAEPQFPIFDSSITGGNNEKDCVVMKDATKIGNVPVGDGKREEVEAKRDGKREEVEAKRDGNVKVRRSGKLWTEVEHKQFLLGMRRFGKGDWKTIAREFVKTRTPTQVASHAQKYFKKLARTTKVKRRSIFDITLPAVQPQQLTVANGFGVGTGVGSKYLNPCQNQLPFVVANEVPNVSNKMPNVMGQPWLAANGAPLVINEVPNQIGRLRLVANEMPLVVNEAPNSVNEVPSVNTRPSLVANGEPLVVNEVPNVVNEVPNGKGQPWLEANEVPLVVSETLNAVNEEPKLMGQPWSPLLLPPENWCLDSDFDIFDLDFEDLRSLLSN
ncbi:hypothetical protein vseg_002355 [Gypsophila vaccaria]